MTTGALIGLDTATDRLSVAALVPGDPAPLREEQAGPGPDGRPRHSELLLAAVERCVEAAGGWESVTRVAVGLGPGSYTGLRIGISTARALAQARGLELAGVGTLAALARGISERDAAAERPALPVLDARRGEAFAALHAPGGAELREPFVAAPEELAEWVATLEEPPLAAGEGSLRFRQQLEAAGATVAPEGDAVHRVAARQVCSLGAGAATLDAEAVRPIYLREPDAKRWLARDLQKPPG